MEDYIWPVAPGPGPLSLQIIVADPHKWLGQEMFGDKVLLVLVGDTQ